jgi:hypothetical protein
LSAHWEREPFNQDAISNILNHKPNGRIQKTYLAFKLKKYGQTADANTISHSMEVFLMKIK